MLKLPSDAEHSQRPSVERPIETCQKIIIFRGFTPGKKNQERWGSVYRASRCAYNWWDPCGKFA